MNNTVNLSTNVIGQTLKSYTPLPASNASLEQLTNALIVNILCNLSFKELISFGKTCKRCKDLSDSDVLWKNCFPLISSKINSSKIIYFLSDGSTKYLNQFNEIISTFTNSGLDKNTFALNTKMFFVLIKHRRDELNAIKLRLSELTGPNGLVAIAEQKYEEALASVDEELYMANCLDNIELRRQATILNDQPTIDTCKKYEEDDGTEAYNNSFCRLENERESLEKRSQASLQYIDIFSECLNFLECSATELTSIRSYSKK